MSRTSVPERGVVARGLALLGLAIFLAPLLLLLSSRSADAATLCLPEADATACIAGTMGTRADPIEGVDVILTKPDGSTETQTTGHAAQILASSRSLWALWVARAIRSGSVTAPAGPAGSR